MRMYGQEIFDWKNAQLDTNILTYIQEGTLIWGNEESCFNAERALTDLYMHLIIICHDDR